MSAAERWLPVPGAPGYEVSDQGNVRCWRPWNGTALPRPLRLTANSTTRYLFVGIYYAHTKRRARNVHALVAEAFYGPRPTGHQVRHLDGDQQNNHLANLKYGTPSENARDAVLHGTHSETRKTHCSKGHPFDEENTYIHANSRKCRTCMRRNTNAWKAAKRALLLDGGER